MIVSTTKGERMLYYQLLIMRVDKGIISWRVHSHHHTLPVALEQYVSLRQQMPDEWIRLVEVHMDSQPLSDRSK